MFTGLIEELGEIRSISKKGNSMRLSIAAHKIMTDLAIGDSIAINGICLTVTDFASGRFSVDVMPETVSRTSLNGLKVGSKINLERAMAADGRFGGHFVSGHIDGVATLLAKKSIDNAEIFKFKFAAELQKYLVPKGSIAVDGISLTIADLGVNEFTVSIIPHTLRETNLADLELGDQVNLEVDMLAKYVESILSGSEIVAKQKKNNITEEFLKEQGF